MTAEPTTRDLTTREADDIFVQPEWRIRRIVDAMPGVTRFGGKRVIPRSLLPQIAIELQRRGWLPTEAVGK